METFDLHDEQRSDRARDCRELLRVIAASRAKAGCLAMRGFQSLREPTVFSIRSEWVDEAAFDPHAQLPHAIRFLHAAETLLTHPIQGLRSQEIAGGAEE